MQGNLFGATSSNNPFSLNGLLATPKNGARPTPEFDAYERVRTCHVADNVSDDDLRKIIDEVLD